MAPPPALAGEVAAALALPGEGEVDSLVERLEGASCRDLLVELQSMVRQDFTFI